MARHLGVRLPGKQPSAHPDDILIVAFYNDRVQHNLDLRFATSQIYSSGQGRRFIEGRRFRRAYYTEGALTHGSLEFWETLHRSSRMMQHPATDSPSEWGHILRVEHFFERETNVTSHP